MNANTDLKAKRKGAHDLFVDFLNKYHPNRTEAVNKVFGNRNG